MIRHRGGLLHHNFVVAVLNDLFGIQARGGCSCAGPYGHRLLGIDPARSQLFQDEILDGCEGIKPGWVRLNFNYFITEPVFDYILAAVELVADQGWRLLPDYDFCPTTGSWKHRGKKEISVMRLADIRYDAGKMEYRSRHYTEPEWVLPSYLERARVVFAEAEDRTGSYAPDPNEMPEHFERLRWFSLPAEVFDELTGGRFRGPRFEMFPNSVR